MSKNNIFSRSFLRWLGTGLTALGFAAMATGETVSGLTAGALGLVIFLGKDMIEE